MKIGIFDSGYGGLTILEKIRARLPQYDYIYFDYGNSHIYFWYCNEKYVLDFCYFEFYNGI